MARVKDNPFSYWIKGSSFDAWSEANDLEVTEAQPELVWVDLETTGLDSQFDVTLQAGIILTDRFGRVCLDGAADWLVYDASNEKEWDHPKNWDRNFVNMNPFVKEMHTKSGLVKAIQMAILHPCKDRLHPAAVAIEMYEWLNERFGQTEPPKNIKDRMPLSGSTPHFDRSFISADFPIFDSWFHYRVGVDVSAIRENAKLLNPSVIKTQPVKQELHVPIPDLIDSIRLYRHLLRTFIVMDNDNEEAFAA